MGAVPGRVAEGVALGVHIGRIRRQLHEYKKRIRAPSRACRVRVRRRIPVSRDDLHDFHHVSKADHGPDFGALPRRLVLGAVNLKTSMGRPCPSPLSCPTIQTLVGGGVGRGR